MEGKCECKYGKDSKSGNILNLYIGKNLTEIQFTNAWGLGKFFGDI